jgi:hypothetical protein
MPTTNKQTSPKSEKPSEYDNSLGVTSLIGTISHPLKPVLESIRQTILSADPSITAGIKWNSPSFYCNGWFATIRCRKPTQIDVILHCGAKLQADCTLSETIDDPSKLLIWPSKDRALLSFKSEADFLAHHEPFQRIISQWVAYQKRNAECNAV